MKAITHRFNKKRLIIVGATTLFLVILASYAVWSGTVWSDYHEMNARRKSETKSSLESALKMPSGTFKERADKLEAFSAVSTHLSNDTASCDTNSLVSWQQAVSSTYKKWHTECEAVQASLGELTAALTRAASFVKNERELAAILSTALAATDKKVTEKSFSSVLEKWKAAASGIAKLQDSSEFTIVKTKASKVAGGVVSAWQAVVKAHAAKDEAKFEAALKTLTDAYSGLEAIEKVSAAQIAIVSRAVQSQYESL